MSILSTLLGNYGDDLAKAAGKVAANKSDDIVGIAGKKMLSEQIGDLVKTQPSKELYDEARDRALNFLNSQSSDDFVMKSKEFLKPGTEIYRGNNSPLGISWTTSYENALKEASSPEDVIKYVIGEKDRYLSPELVDWLSDSSYPQKEVIFNGRKLVDNTGRIVPEDFRDALENLSPKMFDENGNLLTFYHGTPAGGFDVFRDNSYFTPSKWYADIYQSPSASSISYGKEATNPMTYETYLDIRNPFDLSDESARKIYIDDYIKGGNAIGINPYLDNYDDIKSIDWTEIENLIDFLKENGYDYDAVIGNEGGFFDAAGDVVSRGDSYIPFSGSQVKIINRLLGK